MKAIFVFVVVIFALLSVLEAAPQFGFGRFGGGYPYGGFGGGYPNYGGFGGGYPGYGGYNNGFGGATASASSSAVANSFGGGGFYR